MTSFTNRWMLLLGLLAIGLPTTSLAESPREAAATRRVPARPQNGRPFDDVPAGDPFALIQQRLADLDKKGNSLKELQDLYKKLARDPELFNTDPAMRKRLEEIIKNSGLSLDPNDPGVKRLQEWLKNRPASSTAPLSPEAQEDLKRLLDSLKNRNTNSNSSNPPVPIPVVPPPEPSVDPVPPPSPINDAERDSRREFMEWLLKQSRNLDNGRFQNSDLAKQIRNDLTRFASNGTFRDGRRWATDSKLGQRFSELTKDMRSLRLNVALPKPNITLPRGSLPNLPNLGGWARPPAVSGALPGIRPPGMPSASAPSRDLFFLVLALAVAGIVGWRIYKLLGPFGKKDALALKNLSWPTAPGAVATRADLVRAFEFLALALLGRESRTWNHLHVAAKLGGDTPERREAAGTLAALYEQARYAPGDEPLSPDAFTSAQRSLTLLSGGAA